MESSPPPPERPSPERRREWRDEDAIAPALQACGGGEMRRVVGGRAPREMLSKETLRRCVRELPGFIGSPRQGGEGKGEGRKQGARKQR